MLGAGSAGAVTLTSNLGQITSNVTQDLSAEDAAQGFFPGSNAADYEITEIKVKFGTVPNSAATVTAYITDGNTSTDEIVATLTNPATWSTTSTFEVPSGTVLASGTYYFMIRASDGLLATSGADAQDSGGIAGWSIANGRFRRTTATAIPGGGWNFSSNVLQIAVEGTVVAETIPPELVSASSYRFTVGGAALTSIQLAYDEDLDGDSIPATTDFVVKVQGGSVGISSVARNPNDHDTLLVVLATNPRPGESITISYTVPMTNPIQDAAGNDAAALADHVVTNTLAATAPEAPGDLAAAAVATDGTRMDLSWTTPWNNGDAITKFQVRYAAGTSVAASTTWDDITGSGASTTSHQVTGLDGDTEYTFEIRAVNGIGNGTESSVTARTAQAPRAPDLSAAAKDQSIDLEWTIANHGTSDVTRVEYRIKATTGGTYSDWTDTGATASNTGGTATIGSLDNGTEYTVQVRGVNAVGDGDPSNEPTATPQAPPAITSVAITSDPGTDNTYAIGDDIVVTFTFDKNITLSGTGVDPLISLNIGTEELNPSCTVGTPPTMDLVCTQTVDENWEDSDGVDVGGNSLSELGKRIVGPLEQRADTTHSGLAEDSDHKVDGIKPTLSSAAASSDLTKVVLSFSEALTETPAPAAGDFTLDVDSGTAPTIDSVAVDGRDVTLSLSAAVDTSNAYTIDYTAGTNPIKDVPGNAAEDISGQSVSTVDTTPPTFVSANIPANNAHWIVLTYSETLDSTSIPAKSAFTVEVEGNDRTPTAVAGDASGTAIILGVDPAIRPGDTVTVSYSKPGTNPLQDAASNEVASFTDQAVSNLLAATAPEAPGNLAAALEAVPGTPLRVYADRMVLSWDTPWNNGDAITSYKVRYVEGSSAGGTLAAIAGSGASTTSHTVTGLEPGTEYTFGIVAVNGQGDGDETTVTMTTPAPAWSFTLRDSSNTNVTELTEGGDSATATVSITNNVRFGTDQTVTLEWGSLDVTAGNIQGAGGATAITIVAGESSGSLEISAPQKALGNYEPSVTGALTATHGGTEIGSIDLTFVDDEDPSVASITDAPTTVTEGENIEIEITLTPPHGLLGSAQINFAVTDADGALTGTLPTNTRFSGGQARQTVTLTTADNTTQNDGTRDVTFTLAPNADAPYTLGTDRSVTITVRRRRHAAAGAGESPGAGRQHRSDSRMGCAPGVDAGPRPAGAALRVPGAGGNRGVRLLDDDPEQRCDHHQPYVHGPDQRHGIHLRGAGGERRGRRRRGPGGGDADRGRGGVVRRGDAVGGRGRDGARRR